MRRSPHDLGAGQRADAVDETCAVIDPTIDEGRQAVAPQLTKRRVDRKPAGASRPLRVPVDLVPRRIFGHEVRIANRQAAQMGLAMPHGDEAAVLRHVQPLVAIRRPAVGQVDPRGERVEPRAGAGEQSERAIDVHPGAVAMRQRHQRRERIEDAEIQVARVERDDRRAAAVRRARPRASPVRAVRRRRPATRATGGHRCPGSAARGQRDTWCSARGEHTDRRRPCESLLGDVPAALHEAGDRGPPRAP